MGTFPMFGWLAAPYFVLISFLFSLIPSAFLPKLTVVIA